MPMSSDFSFQEYFISLVISEIIIIILISSSSSFAGQDSDFLSFMSPEELLE